MEVVDAFLFTPSYKGEAEFSFTIKSCQITFGNRNLKKEERDGTSS